MQLVFLQSFLDLIFSSDWPFSPLRFVGRHLGDRRRTAVENRSSRSTRPAYICSLGLESLWRYAKGMGAGVTVELDRSLGNEGESALLASMSPCEPYRIQEVAQIGKAVYITAWIDMNTKLLSPGSRLKLQNCSRGVTQKASRCCDHNNIFEVHKSSSVNPGS